MIQKPDTEQVEYFPFMKFSSFPYIRNSFSLRIFPVVNPHFQNKQYAGIWWK